MRTRIEFERADGSRYRVVVHEDEVSSVIENAESFGDTYSDIEEIP